ncbi:unnamed protein product [Orchesella dallaii]|uniref:Uncharacterized protein n=1 Tax=Orchesella dallaii TaxID=48710 RepID=A0ABP1RCV5_9HEXA
MYKPGKKRPLGEYLGENAGENQTKRRRYDNIVLLRGRRRRHNQSNNVSDITPQREIRTRTGESSSTPPLGLVTAGKRKKPGDEQPVVTIEEKSTDENDIISELTKQFKKARLRPVYFTISTFIEQNVDEVGFTLADDEPEQEVTFRFSLPIKTPRNEVVNDAVSEEATLTLSHGGSDDANYGGDYHPINSGERFNTSNGTDIGDNFTATSSVFVFKAGRQNDERDDDEGRQFKKLKTSQE